MERLLQGKVALITGCDQGIGLSICKTFVSQGAMVYANILKEESADIVMHTCDGLAGTVVPVCFDITDKQHIMDCIKQIKKTAWGGTLDILVNNAGVKKDGPVEMIDDRNIDFMFDVNVFGVIHLTQAALKLMKRNPAGGRS